MLGSLHLARNCVEFGTSQFCSLLSYNMERVNQMIHKVFFPLAPLLFSPLKASNYYNFTRCLQKTLHIHIKITNLNTYKMATFYIRNLESERIQIWTNETLNSVYFCHPRPIPLSCIQIPEVMNISCSLAV